MEATWAFEYEDDITPLPLRALRPRTDRASLTIGEDNSVVVRFGPFSVSTDFNNICEASVTGPYTWWRIAGGPRISLKDHGLTLATTTNAGVCLRFSQPIAPVVRGLPRHPGLTATVVDPQSLVDYIESCRVR